MTTNATIRQEYVKCGDPDCQTSHGPYLYAYWKQDKKLKKRYVGKNFEDFGIRKIAKEVKLKPSQYSKFIFTQGEVDKGNLLAKEYLEKLKKEEVSIEWAHRVLISQNRQQRMLKMMAIADDRHFIYDNETELVQFIDSEMQKEGLDIANEENLDSYLNTKFM
jgi:NAD(P)H-flavin reductase